MFCQKCGAENKDGSKFCNSCGADFHQVQAATPTTTKNRNKITILILIFIVIAVIGLFLLAAPKPTSGQTEEERIFEETFHFKMAGDNSGPAQPENPLVKEMGLILTIIGICGAIGGYVYYQKSGKKPDESK